MAEQQARGQHHRLPPPLWVRGSNARIGFCALASVPCSYVNDQQPRRSMYIHTHLPNVAGDYCAGSWPFSSSRKSSRSLRCVETVISFVLVGWLGRSIAVGRSVGRSVGHQHQQLTNTHTYTIHSLSINRAPTSSWRPSASVRPRRPRCSPRRCVGVIGWIPVYMGRHVHMCGVLDHTYTYICQRPRQSYPKPPNPQHNDR